VDLDDDQGDFTQGLALQPESPQIRENSSLQLLGFHTGLMKAPQPALQENNSEIFAED
jgi:hypothetical protein